MPWCPREYRCFLQFPAHVRRVSLNRTEQMLYAYVLKRPEERQYWREKVRALAAGLDGASGTVSKLDAELWRYYLERSAVEPAFKADIRAYGARKTSMKNLAEYLVRLWTDPKPRPTQGPGAAPEN